jgi:PRTRC genetic system ThiF family protein
MPRKTNKNSLLKLPEPPRRVHQFPAALHSEALKIALVGCGGNGAQMLTKLARLHYALTEIGRPGLKAYVFDPDTVSRANIGRQLFAPSDIGQFKASVLTNRINAFYGLDWQAAPKKYPGCVPGIWTDSFQAPDILITCVDSAKARRDIYKLFAAHPAGAPRYWLDMGNMKLSGQVILGEPRECQTARAWAMDSRGFERSFVAGQMPDYPLLPHVVDMFPDLLKRRKEDNEPSCSLADALNKQSLFINDAITTHAAQLLDDLLRIGEISVHGYFINLESGITRGIPIPESAIVQEPQKTIRQRVRVRAA